MNLENIGFSVSTDIEEISIVNKNLDFNNFFLFYKFVQIFKFIKYYMNAIKINGII